MERFRLKDPSHVDRILFKNGFEMTDKKVVFYENFLIVCRDDLEEVNDWYTLESIRKLEGVRVLDKTEAN